MSLAVDRARRAARYRALRVRLRYDRWRRRDISSELLHQTRQEFELLGTWLGTPTGVTCRPIAVGSVPGEWTTVAGSDPDRVVLYLHGGGFTMGSINASRHGLGKYVTASGLTGLNIDYRLAPEDPFPAAVDDALLAYRWLLEQFAPEHIVVLGESAGGGLAFSLLLAAREQGLALPAGVATISAWADLTLSGQSYCRAARRDLSLTRERLALAAALYLDGADPADPLASPALADLHGLPPALLLASRSELVYDDSVTLARRLEAAGGTVQRLFVPRMLHCWPTYGEYVARAGADLALVGAWLAEQVAAHDVAP